MSMVEYMYKLLYGRRLTAVDAPTQSCSLPGDVLRWRLSRALQQCASIDSGSSPNVVSRRCSESTIVAPRLQCAAAASSPTSGANVTPGALVTPHSIGDSSNLFTDLLMTASCHDPSLGHVTWPDADAQDHQPSDVKPSCRYSRCSSPLMLTDKVDGNADCASMYQLPLTGLLTAEEYQTADVPFSPSAAYYLSAENSAYLPSYACQSTSSTGDEFDAGATTSPPFQPRSFPPSSAVKYDDDRMTCCCDRSEDGPGANAECPCAEGRSPWQQVNEYYSLTAGYSFTCSRSVVYDARFSARWQHRKERQRHCHSNRSSSSAAAASNATYLVQDSIASGASSADSTGVESRCHSAHLQPPLATSSSGGMRTSRKSVAGMPTVCASLTGNSGLQCAVCGDNAACQHYGVRTCEGCKGFFKRTVQKNSKYVCLSGRNCIIDKRRRNRCQYCRFQKCLAVGMVKEVVRRDTLKGRRGRLPSKPKTCQSRMSSSSASAAAAAAQHVSQLRPPQSPPVSLITALVRAFVDSTPDLPSLDYSQCYEIDLSQCSNATPKRTRQLCYSLVERSSEVIVQWAESVPGFIDLGSEDRKILIRGALIELLTLRLAYRFSPGDSSMTFCDGTVLHITQCKSGFGDNWFESVSDLSRSFHRQPGAIDLSVVSCLAALVLFTDRCSLRDPHRVELLQEAVLDTLRSHCAYRCGALSCSSRPGAGRLMVARALNGLVELRPVARQSATVLRQLLSVECATNDYHTSVLKDSLSELHEI